MTNAHQSAIEMDQVAGVDGVTGGWVMAVTGVERGTPIEFWAWRSFENLWSEAQTRGLAVVGVDIPIGLSGVGRRKADTYAKKRLGRQRENSVFHAPAHCTLRARSRGEAYDCNRRAGHPLSPLALSLLPKIREVRNASGPDAYVDDARPRLAEVHPEVSFTELAGEPMSHSKKHQPGVAERLAALEAVFSNVGDAVGRPIQGPPRPSLDDRLDAAAAAWTARRIFLDDAICLGEGEPPDATGYPMNIWA